jgi:hypothetical protein
MVSISQSVRLTKSEDGGILLDIEGGGMFSLNPVGTRIVELLATERSIASLAVQIGRDFGVCEEIASRDVNEFLSHLRELRLLRERGNGLLASGEL